MSRENLEIVRRMYEASARRDTETLFSLYDPEVVWDLSRHPRGQLFDGPGFRRGRQALFAGFREWYEAFEDFEHHLQELIDTGEHVVSVGTDTGRGRESGVRVETVLAGVWTIHNGKVVSVVWYPTREEALEAARLPD